MSKTHVIGQPLVISRCPLSTTWVLEPSLVQQQAVINKGHGQGSFEVMNQEDELQFYVAKAHRLLSTNDRYIFQMKS